jgi:hypothetical protein
MKRWSAGIADVLTMERRAAGFVLMDALVSLVITSVVVAVLFQAISQNLTATERAADRYQAALLARSKLAGLGTADLLAAGRTEGRFDAVFSWVLTIDEDATLSDGHEAAPLTLLSVRLDVRWQRRARQFQLTYRTRRLIPRQETSASAIGGGEAGRPGRMA